MDYSSSLFGSNSNYNEQLQSSLFSSTTNSTSYGTSSFPNSSFSCSCYKPSKLERLLTSAASATRGGYRHEEDNSSNDKWNDVIQYLKTLDGKHDVKQMLFQHGNRDCTVLHLCIHNRYPYHVIEAVVKSYPYALEIYDCDGYLPIHTAVEKYYYDVRIYKLLISTCSKCLQMVTTTTTKDDDYYNNKLSLPIHLLFTVVGRNHLEDDTRVHDIIKEIVIGYPAGLQCQDKDGNLPIHLLSILHVPTDIVNLCIKLCPSMLYMRNHLQQLPIHTACYHMCRNIDDGFYYSSSNSEKDIQERNDIVTSNIKQLLNGYQESIVQTCKYGKYYNNNTQTHSRHVVSSNNDWISPKFIVNNLFRKEQEKKEELEDKQEELEKKQKELVLQQQQQEEVQQQQERLIQRQQQQNRILLNIIEKKMMYLKNVMECLESYERMVIIELATHVVVEHPSSTRSGSYIKIRYAAVLEKSKFKLFMYNKKRKRRSSTTCTSGGTSWITKDMNNSNNDNHTRPTKRMKLFNLELYFIKRNVHTIFGP